MRRTLCVSAGNTGALMAISRYVLKTLPGIEWPAIAKMLPNMKGGATCVLDLGANVDCSPEHLLQFGIMRGRCWLLRCSTEISLWSVCSISALKISKGNEVVKQAADLKQARRG